MSKRLLSAIGLIIGGQLMSCHREVATELPPETLSGQNTFGCLVNGQVWIPGGPVPWGWGTPNLRALIATYPDGKVAYLSIRAKINKGEKWINFLKSGIDQPGVYTLANDSTSYISYRDENLSNDCLDFYSSDGPDRQILDGQLTLKRYDAVVAGRFSFTLVQPGCDTIRITDGRFDIPF